MAQNDKLTWQIVTDIKQLDIEITIQDIKAHSDQKAYEIARERLDKAGIENYGVLYAYSTD